MLDRFEGVQTQVLGLSVDSAPCLKAWAESLGGITYPLLSDFYPHGQAAQLFDVLRREGYSERAIFVIDRQGLIRYVDVHDIEQQPDNEELFRVLDELEPEAARQYALQQNAIRQEAARQSQVQSSPSQGASVGSAPGPVSAEQAGSLPRVILYCTPWCPACRRARSYLRQHGIPFEEVDIAHDRSAAQRVKGWTGGYETTPTFDIGGKIIVEFSEANLDEILGIG